MLGGAEAAPIVDDIIGLVDVGDPVSAWFNELCGNTAPATGPDIALLAPPILLAPPFNNSIRLPPPAPADPASPPPLNKPANIGINCSHITLHLVLR